MHVCVLLSSLLLLLLCVTLLSFTMCTISCITMLQLIHDYYKTHGVSTNGVTAHYRCCCSQRDLLHMFKTC